MFVRQVISQLFTPKVSLPKEFTKCNPPVNVSKLSRIDNAYLFGYKGFTTTKGTHQYAIF